MSFNTLYTASVDVALQQRTISCATQQAFNNVTLHDTKFGALVRATPAEGVRMVWPVAIDTEAQYASALANNVHNPGGDESVISDGNILSAVQAHWPADPPPEPTAVT